MDRIIPINNEQTELTHKIKIDCQGPLLIFECLLIGVLIGLLISTFI